MIPIELTDFQLQVVTKMLENFYAVRLERLEQLKTMSQDEFTKSAVIICIEARVIATYLLDIWFIQQMERGESIEKS